MVKFIKAKIKPSLIAIDAVLCTAILGIMDFYLFPQIQKTTAPLKAFDLQSFGYSFDTAKNFLNLLSEQGKNLYLHFQLPLDFLFPILYTFLFIAIFIKLSNKGENFIFLPLLLFVCDYAENVCTALMLKSGAELSKGLVTFGSIMNASKSVLMYICGILVIVFLVIFMKKKNSDKVSVK